MVNALLAEGTTSSDAYKQFINTVDSEATKRNYRFAFSLFMKYCGLQDYDKMLQFEPRKLERLISDYITHLKVDKQLAYNTINMYFSAISHFYQMNQVNLNWKILSKFKGKKRMKVEDRPYSKDQIRQLLDFADLRMKCIILLMSSSGLRRGAIPTLRIKDLTKIEEHSLYKIYVYKNEAEAYTTFCTPECAKHLDQYFEWRVLQGEKLSGTSPVIRKKFNSLNVARPKPLTTNAMNWMINELLDKSCIRPRSENRLHKTEIMEFHAFRKYFQTTSKLAGMDLILINRCMGHSSGLEDSYLKLSEEQVLEGNDKMIGYIGAIDDLTINEEHRLKRKVKEMQVHHTEEWEMLRKEMTEMKKNLRIT